MFSTLSCSKIPTLFPDMSAAPNPLVHETRLCALAAALRHLSRAALADPSERQACYARAGLISAAGVSFADDIEARRRATLRLRLFPPAPVASSSAPGPIHA